MVYICILISIDFADSLLSAYSQIAYIIILCMHGYYAVLQESLHGLEEHLTIEQDPQCLSSSIIIAIYS